MSTILKNNPIAKRLQTLSGWTTRALVLMSIISTSLTSCGIYSFTGADIGNAKTISIKQFPNYAPLAQPTLSQNFTETLRDKFISQTNLDLVDKNGDLRIEGTITGYETRPVSIQSNETAALNRLSITISVTYVNTLDETKNFETSFTRFADFESTVSLSSVQDQLEEEINTQLVQDIFNKSVINW